jgi:hypothetical protein
VRRVDYLTGPCVVGLIGLQVVPLSDGGGVANPTRDDMADWPEDLLAARITFTRAAKS